MALNALARSFPALLVESMFVCFSLCVSRVAARWREALRGPLLLTLLLGASSAQALEQVRLQLNWQHQFEFAGFYAAKAMGYYRDAGLQVEILASAPGEHTNDLVIDGQAEFGVSDPSLLLERNKGHPVVVLAVIFQHSPMVLLVPKNGAKRIQDLRGKRVMIDYNTELRAYFRQQGLAEDSFTQVEPSYDPQDLIAGRVDALQAYASDEPEYLRRAGFEYRAFSAREAGIDFYDLNLFTTQTQIDQHPERVKAFREASLRGWKYAMEHPDEIMEVLLREYSQKHAADHLRFQYQQMVPLIQPVLVEMGYMNPERWQRMVDSYIELGLLPSDFSLDGFTYDSTPERDLTWYYTGLLIAFVLLVLISLVAVRFARLSARLKAEVAMRSALQDELQSQLWVDYLTGLASRRHFIEQARGELARSARYGLPLSLCMLDLDNFKLINDRYGHQTGDLVLQRFSEICRATLREIDIIGRLGGEEFAIVLPVTAIAEAQQVSERLRAAIAQTSVQTESGVLFQFTTSIGLAQLQSPDESLDSLLGRADAALYEAKSTGRNKVCVG
jgi:diguanylate cyclase (GGDEF)-like protein